MNKERMIEIGKFLEMRLFIHRQVEHNDKLTKEEKMIQELYDNNLELQIRLKKIEEYIYNHQLFGMRYGKTLYRESLKNILKLLKGDEKE